MKKYLLTKLDGSEWQAIRDSSESWVKLFRQAINTEFLDSLGLKKFDQKEIAKISQTKSSLVREGLEKLLKRESLLAATL